MPGVAEGLLESERDTVLLWLNAENHSIYAVALLEQVAGMANFLVPGHLRDVNEAFNAGFDLDECAEVGQAGDRAGDALAGDKAVGGGLPGLRL